MMVQLDRQELLVQMVQWGPPGLPVRMAPMARRVRLVLLGQMA